MRELLEYIVKSLVKNTDAIKIDEQIIDHEINLTLSVDPSDMGMIIGKSGQTIKAIRKLLIARAMAENVKVNLMLDEQAAPVA
jgi:uncharacterized protein